VYRVHVEPPALDDIRKHYEYLRANAYTAGYADEWYDSIEAAILSLAEYPLSFGLAPESDHFAEEIRHRLVGSYRILFTVQGQEVHVLHVRHGRQNVMHPPS
jgi:plasmid stabilization system protein ParE